MSTSSPAVRGSPFVGLSAYTQDDADIFFGRDTERKVLISNLRASRLTLLYARSGTGKSSLLRAGVVPRLRDLAERSRAERGSARHIPVVFSSWHDDPTAGLIDAIEAAIAPIIGGPADLPRSRLAEVVRAAGQAAGANLLVILDQFEEYLLAHPNETRASQFANEVAECIRDPDIPAHVLIAVREDAYSGLGDLFKGQIENVYGNYLHLENLSRESARAAITEPIKQSNARHPELLPVKIEPRLVDAVLDQLSHPGDLGLDRAAGDVTGNSNGDHSSTEIAAPYLQLVMSRLWDTQLASPEGEASEPMLNLGTLDGLGGAEEIVRTHVDRVLDALPEGDRDVAVDVFQHLVTRSRTKIALSAPDLADTTEHSEASLEALLDRLTQADVRILQDVPPAPGSRETRFEISHDLLASSILTWRLRNRAARLERERNAAERTARVEARRARRFRIIAISLAGLLVAIALGAAYKFRHDAQSAHQAATAGAMAARSQSLLGIDPQGALAQALEAVELHRTPAVDEAFRTVAPTALRETRILRPPHLHGARWAQFVDADRLATYDTTSGQTGAFVLWSLSTGEPLRILRVDPDGFDIGSAATSDRGNIVVTADAAVGHPAEVWSLPSGNPVASIGSNVRATAVSADGYRVITWNERSASVWTAAGRRIARIPAPRDMHVIGASVSPNHRTVGELVYPDSASNRVGELILWASGSQQTPIPLRGLRPRPATSLVFNPKLPIAAVSEGPSGLVVDLSTGRSRHLLPTSQGTIDDIAFSAGGGKVLTASEDGIARVYRASDGLLLSSMPTTSAMKAGAISQDGTLVATAGNDGIARIWNSTSGTASLTLGGNASPLTSVAFNHQGTRLATAAKDGVIRIWSIEPPVAAAVPGAAYDVRIDPADPSLVGIAETDGGGYLWRLPSPSPTPIADAGSTNGFAFSPDGKKMLTTTRAHATAHIRSVQPPYAVEDTVTLPLPKSARSGSSLTIYHHPSFSADGRHVVLATSSGAIVWAPSLGDRKGLSGYFGPGRTPGPVTVALYSPDGKTILTGEAGGLTDWRVARSAQTRRPITPKSGRTIRFGGPNPVVAAAFSRTGRYIAAANTQGYIRVWSARTLTPLTRRLRIAAIPTDLDFSADGHRLLVAATDGTVVIWSWKSGNVLGTLQTHAGPTRAAEYVPGSAAEIISGGDDGLVGISKCVICVPIPKLKMLAEGHLHRLELRVPR